MTRRILLTSTGLAVALAFAASAASAQEHGQVHGQAPSSVDVPLYDDLGDLHHEISTAVPLAQDYFDQG
ncbi:MAG: hypothetical protein PVI01_18140, partial [Gemmatimonadales bacterium]